MTRVVFALFPIACAVGLFLVEGWLIRGAAACYLVAYSMRLLSDRPTGPVVS